MTTFKSVFTVFLCIYFVVLKYVFGDSVYSDTQLSTLYLY